MALVAALEALRMVAVQGSRFQRLRVSRPSQGSDADKAAAGVVLVAALEALRVVAVQGSRSQR